VLELLFNALGEIAATGDDKLEDGTPSTATSNWLKTRRSAYTASTGEKFELEDAIPVSKWEKIVAWADEKIKKSDKKYSLICSNPKHSCEGGKSKN
jgi:hypothetical protein